MPLAAFVLKMCILYEDVLHYNMNHSYANLTAGSKCLFQSAHSRQLGCVSTASTERSISLLLHVQHFKLCCVEKLPVTAVQFGGAVADCEKGLAPSSFKYICAR